MGTGPHKSLATPSGVCHCLCPLPPALWYQEQTVSLRQPSLFGKHLSRAGRLCQGPSDGSWGPAGRKQVQGEPGLQLLLGRAWGPGGWNSWGKGLALGHGGAPQQGMDEDPLWLQAWLGGRLQGPAALGWERTEVSLWEESEETVSAGSNPGSAASCLWLGTSLGAAPATGLGFPVGKSGMLISA